MKKLTKSELIELARNVMLKKGTEEELDEMSDLFDRNVPHPSGISLAYFPDGYGTRKDVPSEEDYSPTPEEVVEMALNPRIIITPKPSIEPAAGAHAEPAGGSTDAQS